MDDVNQADPGQPSDASLDNDRPRLLVWQDELNASAGYRATALMDYVRRIGYVFQANVAQYKALVAGLQDPSASLEIFDISNPQAHDDLLSEVERLLHNVLMALSTRIDQQRSFMSRHFAEDAELSAEYSAAIRSHFDAYRPSSFLRDLRNYLTHYQLPVAQSRQEFTSNSFSVTFILVGESLLEWDRWTSGAKSWLESQGDEIDIVEAVDGYACIAGSFDKWLYDRIRREYAAEIMAYEREAAVFDREWDRTFGTFTPPNRPE